MQNRIITVSRQFGSGGRTVGRQTAERLGIPCYDQKLIEEIARESGFDKEYIDDKAEETPGGGSWIVNALTSQAEFMMQNMLWEVQKKVLLGLAEQGPCVIVGRCADYVLKDVADCLTVFVHAPLAVRAERIVRLYGEREDSPEQRLKDKDKRRAAYYRFHTNQDWGAADNYHIALDSGALGIDKCVEIIADLYKTKQN